MNSTTTALIVGGVYTAEEILKVELHQIKGIYNRPALYLNANTVDGNKTIHINAQDIVRGYHKESEYTKQFLKLKFKLIDGVNNGSIAVYAGELQDIEDLLDVQMLLDYQCYDEGTTYVSVVRPGAIVQIFKYSEEDGTVTSPYTHDVNKIHPTILESLKKVKANNGRVFVD